MAVTIGEVVKEFVIDVPGMGADLKARIVRSADSTGVDWFDWSISHHCRPTQGAGVYYPSKTRDRDITVVEHLLRAYATSFTAEHEVIPNATY